MVSNELVSAANRYHFVIKSDVHSAHAHIGRPTACKVIDTTKPSEVEMIPAITLPSKPPRTRLVSLLVQLI